MKSLLLTTLTILTPIRALVLPAPPLFPYASSTIIERRAFDPPKWMFANSTTEDATADGSLGVIIEPDLDPSKPGRDGATIKKIKFGPYTLAAGQKKEFPIGAFGLSPIEMGRPPPCTNCYITAMQLNLEYPDGKIANVDTGAWLHHVDISVTGTDYTCPSSIISTIANGGDPSMGGRRIYAGGNERVPVRMNSLSKYGIDPGRGTMGGAVELMNEAVKPITVFVTMLFEFVPKDTPGYKEGQLIWVDVTNCAKESDFTPQKGTYEKKSRDFVMRHDGELVFAQGHMHDGEIYLPFPTSSTITFLHFHPPPPFPLLPHLPYSKPHQLTPLAPGGTKVELYINNRLSCTSKQIYANRRGHYTEPNDGTILKDQIMPAASHISDVGVCKDWGKVKKGDVLSVKGYFDDTQHMQMSLPGSPGTLEAQMGIMWTFVGFT